MGGKALAAAVAEARGRGGLHPALQVHKSATWWITCPDEHKADVKRKLQNALCDDGLCRRQARPGPPAPRTDGSQSAQRAAWKKAWKKRSPFTSARAGSAPPYPVLHERDRVSLFIVETVCRNVKRWRDGDHIERWVASGLLVAERQFRKVIGHRQIPLLLSSMATLFSKKPIAKRSYCRVIYENRESLSLNDDPGNFVFRQP